MATVSLVQALTAGLVTPTTGTPLASGVCRFYQPGTLTPVVVYSDEAGASPITQPVVLSAGGTAEVYTLNPARMICKDATDSTSLYDVNINTTVDDSMYVTSASFNGGAETRLATILDAVVTSLGGTDWNYKQSAGATQRTVKSWMSETQVSVVDFGGVGNDATDNTTPFTNAIAALVAAGGGVLYVPPGTYRIASALSIAGSAAITIRGAGATASVIKQMGGAANTLTVPGVLVLSVENISLAANGTTGIAVALTSNGTPRAAFRNVLISGHDNGISGFGVSDGYAHAFGLEIAIRAASTGYGITGSFENSMLAGLVISSASGTPTGLLVTAALTTLKSSTVLGPYINIVGAGIAVDIPGSALASMTVIGGTVGGAGGAFRLAAACTTKLIVDGTYESAGSTDSRTGLPVAAVFAGSGNTTPTPGVPMRLIANGGGSTVTINQPSPNPPRMGGWVELMCINNSGGAVTWTFAAIFKTSAAVNPATGNCTAIRFTFDSVTAVYRELTRATAAI